MIYICIYIFLVRCGTLKEFSPPQGFSLKLNWTGTNDLKTRSTRRRPQVAAFFFFLFLNFFLNLRTMWKKKSSISKIKKYACRPGVPQRFLVWPTDSPLRVCLVKSCASEWLKRNFIQTNRETHTKHRSDLLGSQPQPLPLSLRAHHPVVERRAGNSATVMPVRLVYLLLLSIGWSDVIIMII